jgi:hypothetical protein
MEKCAFCGTDTELYLNNVPICLKCSEDRERSQKRPPMPPPSQQGPPAPQDSRLKLT